MGFFLRERWSDLVFLPGIFFKEELCYTGKKDLEAAVPNSSLGTEKFCDFWIYDSHPQVCTRRDMF